MIVLGIDTSGYINAVGVSKDSYVLADNRFPARTDTLEQIVDNIDVTLRQAGMTLKDVEGIGVGLGPGSWTGIKVGVTVGKMLAFSIGKPVIGIPTLDAIAYGVSGASHAIYAFIGAGVRDMVYAARYIFENNAPVRSGDYYAGDVRGLKKLITESVTLAGPGALSYKEMIVTENEAAQDKPEAKNEGFTGKPNISSEKMSKNEPARAGHIYAVDIEPSGASVARLAALRFAGGQKDDPLALTPLYLKESTAKVFVNRYLANK